MVNLLSLCTEMLKNTGAESQVHKACEEFSELEAQALKNTSLTSLGVSSSATAEYELAGEVADAEAMLIQLELICGVKPTLFSLEEEETYEIVPLTKHMLYSAVENISLGKVKLFRILKNETYDKANGAIVQVRLGVSLLRKSIRPRVMLKARIAKASKMNLYVESFNPYNNYLFNGQAIFYQDMYVVSKHKNLKKVEYMDTMEGMFINGIDCKNLQSAMYALHRGFTAVPEKEVHNLFVDLSSSNKMSCVSIDDNLLTKEIMDIASGSYNIFLLVNHSGLLD